MQIFSKASNESLYKLSFSVNPSVLEDINDLLFLIFLLNSKNSNNNNNNNNNNNK